MESNEQSGEPAPVAAGTPEQGDPPPATPGPGASLWYCRCGNILGLVYQHWLYVQYRQRRIETCLPARIRCEVCGRKTIRLPERDYHASPHPDGPDTAPGR